MLGVREGGLRTVGRGRLHSLISAGGGHTLLIHQGNVWSWGWNAFGQLGDGGGKPTGGPRARPVKLFDGGKVQYLDGIIAVSSGAGHSLALRSDGTVWSWGLDRYGQLGLGGKVATEHHYEPLLSKATIRDRRTLILHENEEFLISLGLTDKDLYVIDPILGRKPLPSLALPDIARTLGGVLIPKAKDSFFSASVARKIPGLQDIVAISAGAFYSLALAASGTIFAWGWNRYGQLGIGSSNNSNSSPLKVSISTKCIGIVAGGNHSLALSSYGEVFSWGHGIFGQLGHKGHRKNSTTGYDISLKPNIVTGLNFIKSISAGDNFSLALSADGKIFSWGHNNVGQLGLNDSNIKFIQNYSVPREIKALENVVSISSGSNHSLALHSDGQISSWGLNSSGQIGTGKFVGFYNRSPQLMMTNIFKNIPSSLKYISAISAGTEHSLALAADGSLFVCGSNARFQLGTSNSQRKTPLAMRRDKVPHSSKKDGVISVQSSSSSEHALALKSNGEIWAWGNNEEGQFGNGKIGLNVSSRVPILINMKNQSSLNKVVAIGVGGATSFAIQSDSTLLAWGSNFQGKLGVGTFKSKNILYPTFCVGKPKQIIAPPPLRNILSVSCGAWHTIALNGKGEVLVAGQNAYGQLGNGNSNNQEYFSVNTFLEKIVAISVGLFHSLALTANGSIYAWGMNRHGQIGNGQIGNKIENIPTLVANIGEVVGISAGAYHNLAITADGSLWGWGSNNTFQIEKTSRSFVTKPIKIRLPLMNTAKRFLRLLPSYISAGYNSSFVISSNGVTLAWGSNMAHQLGLFGNQVPSYIQNPTIVTELKNSAISLQASNYRTFATKQNWTVSRAGSPELNLQGNHDKRFTPISF